MSNDSLSDDGFGQLTWDYEFHLWRGHCAAANGAVFEVWVETGAWDIVPPIDDTKVDRTITAASRAAFIRIRENEPRVREHLATEFAPLYAQWHDNEQITSREFQSRLELESIQIASDGSAEIYYADGDMFCGHCLIAHLDANGTYERGEMFG